MNEDRRQILEMLSAGKITTDEAERLLTALERPLAATSTEAPPGPGPKARPKYLRVVVEDHSEKSEDGRTHVNVRVPMQLLRAGVRLASLIPAPALNHANEALREQGMEIDLRQLKPENLEDLVEQLNDLSVDVDQKEAGAKVKVRVFCE